MQTTNNEDDYAFFNDVVEHAEEMIKGHEREEKLKKESEQTARKTARLVTRRYLFRIGAGAVTTAVVSIGGYKLFQLPWNEILMRDEDKFDRKGLKLPGGSVLTLGKTVIPEFSDILANMPESTISSIPRIDDDSKPSTAFTVTSGMRQLKIPDGLHKKLPWEQESPTQVVATLKDIPNSARFLVWTNLQDAKGISRAEELRLTYERNRLIATWAGHKVGSEAARIILQILA